MASNQNNVTKSYIKSVFPKYSDASRCSEDLCAALEKFPNLKLFKRECVVDGHLYDMINLEGTLPISYKGNTYNIPLRVMLQEDYPYSAPIIYIQPTEGMRISRDASYLNDRGKVSNEYLSEWKSQMHPNISKVLQRLIILFEDKPPVWTKKTGNMVKAYEERAKRNSFPPTSRRQPRPIPAPRRTETEDIYEDIVPIPDPAYDLPKPSQSAVKLKRDSDGYDIPDNGKGGTANSTNPQSPVQDGFVPHDPTKVNTPGKFFPSPDLEMHAGKDSPFEHGEQSSASGHVEERLHGSQVSEPNVLKTYERRKLIGSGGFAKVYLYESRSTNAKVACKIVDLGLNDDSVQKHATALKHEIRLLGALNHHDFIVKYIAVEEYNNQLAMVMEYFPKGSLYQVLQTSEEGHFSEDMTRVYTWQILQGLKFLHENGVIHRDIKARNILVDEQDTIRIADFGISKKLENLVTKTSGNTDTIGSIYWQSPESLSPKAKSGRKTDVWSLGCTVVEMLLGRPPCDNLPICQASVKILNYQVYPPPNCSDIAKEFLQMCFRRETERPTSHEILANSEFPQYYLESS